MNEKEHFKVPILIGQKQHIETIELWIEQAEIIFKHRREKVQTQTDTWLTISTPPRSWRERLKNGELNKTKSNNNNKSQNGGNSET